MGDVYKTKKANQEIIVKKGEIPLWMIALHLNVHESTLIRWLRVEMNNVEKKKIFEIIDQIKREN